MRSEIGSEEHESEEAKIEKFPDQGTELWSIGYVSSDHEPDNDEEDYEEDAEIAAVSCELRERILKGDEFTMEEFDTISN